MFFPNQPLYIHPPPTQLLSLHHLIARLAHSHLGLNLALSRPSASNQRSTPRQYPLFIPHSVFSSPVRFIHAFVLTLAQDSIVLLIYYLNEVLGIFSHDQRPWACEKAPCAGIGRPYRRPHWIAVRDGRRRLKAVMSTCTSVGSRTAS